MTQSKYLNVDDFWIALKFDLLLFYVLSRQFGKLFLLMFYVAQYGLSEHSGNTVFENVFRFHKNEKSAFSNQFLRFRDGSV